MKILIILATLIAFVLTDEKYDSELDDFDIDELVENERLLESYGRCFLYRGPCTPQGKIFRELMPDAIQTNCAKCTLKQRQMVRKGASKFKVKAPKMWNELVKQEDPKGIYKKNFDDFLNSSD